jgi:hypothetical protein
MLAGMCLVFTSLAMDKTGTTVLSSSPLIIKFLSFAKPDEQLQLKRFAASSFSPSSTFGADACVDGTATCVESKNLARKSEIYWLSPEENAQ